MWATIAIIFVSLLVGYIISNKKEEKNPVGNMARRA